MPYELCRHIKANGTPCKAACMGDGFWCYFHARLHFRHRAVRSAKAAGSPSPLVLPVIEDRESIQVAVSLVAGALATGHIDDKRATAILRALQLACRNLDSHVNIEPLADNVTRSCTPTLDGLDLAPRRMTDNSEPAPYSPRPTLAPTPEESI